VDLFLDGESDVRTSRCLDCGRDYTVVDSFVLDQDGPYAIAKTALHHHDGFEAWMDVIFGSFSDDPAEVDDRVTFGCRVGPVAGSSEPAATAVQAGAAYEDSPSFGVKLSRERALSHDRVADFWSVVDFLLEAEPTINHHVYGHRAPGPQNSHGRDRQADLMAAIDGAIARWQENRR